MVPINSRFAPRELGYVVENGDLEVVFTSDAVVEHVDYVARLQEALPRWRCRRAPALTCLRHAGSARDRLFGTARYRG